MTAFAKRRGATPEEDRARGLIEEGPITRADESDTSWSISFGDSWGCGLSKARTDAVPKVGDMLTLFGTMGYSFHGQALNGDVLWYLSIEEEEAERVQAAADHDQRQRDDFDANRAKLDADYAALPETFRQRIDKFRKTNPNFRVEFESYEMMCCVDAVKIARYCSVERIATEFEGDEPTAADNVLAFQKLPWVEQEKAGVDDGHSGNSFSVAVRLAYHYVTDPGLVIASHGALVPLVGCRAYGCPHDEGPITNQEEESNVSVE